jgi:hypothetical protein
MQEDLVRNLDFLSVRIYVDGMAGKPGRPKTPKENAADAPTEKLTVLLSPNEMKAIDEAAELLSKSDLYGRPIRRSDVVRRFLKLGREADAALADAEKRGKR